ncbi:MoaD/ThiS family protein [Candidatus Woesearchaeota archaeon]|nr:MoaD/ThiS family protein [Candidatus Woesearchaeota archaeon]
MEVYLERENKKRNLKFTGTAKELLEKLGINEAAVLVIRDKELITLDEKIKEKDKIKVVSVVSGG